MNRIEEVKADLEQVASRMDREVTRLQGQIVAALTRNELPATNHLRALVSNQTLRSLLKVALEQLARQAEGDLARSVTEILDTVADSAMTWITNPQDSSDAFTRATLEAQRDGYCRFYREVKAGVEFIREGEDS